MICKECTSTKCGECNGTGKVQAKLVLNLEPGYLPREVGSPCGCDNGQIVAPKKMHIICIARNVGKDTEDCDCQHRKPIGVRGGSIFG